MSANEIAGNAYWRSFSQIDAKIDKEFGIVWVYQKPTPRPCFNPLLVSQVRSVQVMLDTFDGRLSYSGELIPISYHVLDSHTPGIFSMGGDLEFFCDHVRRGDKQGLLRYARLCVDVMHEFIVGFRQPVTTISLVRGDALGGGFEVALSGHVLIAEEQVKMGFPEIMFNTFPGMGSYHLLAQRMPPAQVEKLMLSGRKYSAPELYEMGVVDYLVEEGKGEQAVYDFIRQNQRQRNGFLALREARKKVSPISREDLMEMVSHWVDVTMQISERDLRLMEKLVRAQDRRQKSEISEQVCEYIA